MLLAYSGTKLQGATSLSKDATIQKNSRACKESEFIEGIADATRFNLIQCMPRWCLDFRPARIQYSVLAAMTTC